MINIHSQILFEDNHLLIVNKLPKQLTQGDNTKDLSLIDALKNYLKLKYNKKGNVFIGLANRLDRPCSGIVVFAKTSKALGRVNKMFQKNEIDKKYWAITLEKIIPDEGDMINYLKKNSTKNKSFIVDKQEGGKYAELKYKFLLNSDSYNLYDVALITGRHHQIRVQFANAGAPLKGDIKYGFKRPNNDGSVHLHAVSISFKHPISNEIINIEAKPPEDNLWNFFSENIIHF